MTILPPSTRKYFKGLLAGRLAVVAKLRIFLSLLLLGSGRWGYACHYWRPGLGYPWCQTEKSLTNGAFSSLAVWVAQTWSPVVTCIAISSRSSYYNLSSVCGRVCPETTPPFTGRRAPNSAGRSGSISWEARILCEDDNQFVHVRVRVGTPLARR